MEAMAQIESKANNLTKPPPMEVEPAPSKSPATTMSRKAAGKAAAQPEVDDGRAPMHKIFVESKLISAGDFEMCWPAPNLTRPPGQDGRTFHPGPGGKAVHAAGQVA